MTNIIQILRNLRRKGIENKNAIICPDCGYEVLSENLFEQINDGEYNIFWEHKDTKKNTNGEDVVVSHFISYPEHAMHVPAYIDIHTWCRGTDDDGEYNCERNFTVRYHIIAQEIV